MWEYEHSIETETAAESLWARWADVATWAEWNADIEKVELNGSFAAGSTITMTPRGDEPVVLRLAEVRENETFVDIAEFGGVVIRTMHRLERLEAGRTRITYRTEITGPAAEELGPQVGPAITADFPETMAALVRAADSATGV
ncbi:MAG TPA: SRPBCC family protein [Actinocrinis sp.]|nr:SRPBCC family protein [Actinocrinis sp.]